MSKICTVHRFSFSNKWTNVLKFVFNLRINSIQAKNSRSDALKPKKRVPRSQIGVKINKVNKILAKKEIHRCPLDIIYTQLSDITHATGWVEMSVDGWRMCWWCSWRKMRTWFFNMNSDFLSLYRTNEHSKTQTHLRSILWEGYS